MCRLLGARAANGFEIGPHLAAFSEVARNSREYQGHGWGCAWLEDGRWRIYRNIAPVWEDRGRPEGRTTLLLAHARSAFRDEGIRVENNMPFDDGERVFVFNGELRGVRIREQGRIGAEKIFNFVKRFGQKDLLRALELGLPRIEQRARLVRAMNLIVADTSGRAVFANRFAEDPDYFRMHRAAFGDTQVLCSEPYPGPCPSVDWSPVASGTIARF